MKYLGQRLYEIKNFSCSLCLEKNLGDVVG